MGNDMSNTANQERKEPSEPLVIPPEELERLSKLPIFPTISKMAIESLNRNCTMIFIPPADVD